MIEISSDQEEIWEIGKKGRKIWREASLDKREIGS